MYSCNLNMRLQDLTITLLNISKKTSWDSTFISPLFYQGSPNVPLRWLGIYEERLISILFTNVRNMIHKIETIHKCVLYIHIQISLKLCIVSSDFTNAYIFVAIWRAKNKWVAFFFLQSPSLKCKIGLWSVESAFVDGTPYKSKIRFFTRKQHVNNE